MVLSAISIVSGGCVESTEEEFAVQAAVEGLSRELSEQTMLAKVPSEGIGEIQDTGKESSQSAMDQVEVKMRYPVGFRRRGEVMSETGGEQLTQHSGDHRFGRPCQTY
jgi:hypothetical protein